MGIAFYVQRLSFRPSHINTHGDTAALSMFDAALGEEGLKVAYLPFCMDDLHQRINSLVHPSVSATSDCITKANL